MGEDAHTGLTGEFSLAVDFPDGAALSWRWPAVRYGPSSHIDQREAEARLQALQTINEAKCAPRPLSHRLGVAKEVSL